MSSLLSTPVKVDHHLDDLFKNSAGKSEVATKPVIVQEVTAKINKKNKKQEKKEGQKAFLGFKKAQELIAAANQKRKAEDLEKDTTKKIKKELTPKEKAEKEAKTVFVGNLSVDCIEKEGYKQLKSRFKDCGDIESIRFRSVAFSEPIDRKSAFIARKLHSGRDVVNAYIVFKTTEAVKKALELNGTLFMDKHLRVDSASNSRKHDRKRSVFLGGLPFDVADEEVWEFFKECGEIEFVRVVRDNKTNVGKGFGYVQFKTREPVEKALKLGQYDEEGNEEKKKFREKVKIRIQRCKIPVSEGGRRDVPKKTKKNARPMSKKTVAGKSGKKIPVPKQLEGTRATKDSGKFKIVKTSKKHPGSSKKKKKAAGKK
ncbi:hypothetical protein BDF20DRAFT_863658 [Mycotypha africana]|uniref:uncharacterized protein n=1 Tax=Mycotypha africana TaxID=64632 RepID=UPI002300A773|nr:uncharacterized protein BDF20DRAFT_863658 [Mycotypha africana]KAI8981868.1 hypothetical protein BDF20DRAFT_863658 [Mycotypha africana]